MGMGSCLHRVGVRSDYHYDLQVEVTDDMLVGATLEHECVIKQVRFHKVWKLHYEIPSECQNKRTTHDRAFQTILQRLIARPLVPVQRHGECPASVQSDFLLIGLTGYMLLAGDDVYPWTMDDVVALNQPLHASIETVGVVTMGEFKQTTPMLTIIRIRTKNNNNDSRDDIETTNPNPYRTQTRPKSETRQLPECFREVIHADDPHSRARRLSQPLSVPPLLPPPPGDEANRHGASEENAGQHVGITLNSDADDSKSCKSWTTVQTSLTEDSFGSWIRIENPSEQHHGPTDLGIPNTTYISHQQPFKNNNEPSTILCTVI
eukprot:1393375-Amorphochlora_amoeboformis.AAC.3